MNDAIRRAEIREYVHKAFLAKIMQMNDVRQRRKVELRGELGRHGQSVNSSGFMVGEIEIEEGCIADLLRQKADLYIEAYRRVGLAIGPDVLKDIAHSQVELTAARKSSLIGEAQLQARRTNRPQNLMGYGHLGKVASVAMKEIEANIDLHNLSHSATRTIPTGEKGLKQKKFSIPSVGSERLQSQDGSQGHGDKFEMPNTTFDSPTKETIWTKMWSWVVIGAIDLFVLGGGIAFMTSGHAYAADIFLSAGTTLFVAKFWTWEEARRQPTLNKWLLQAGATLLSFTVCVLALFWNHAINRTVSLSPPVQTAKAGTEAATNGPGHDNGGDAPSEPKLGEQAEKDISSAMGGRTISIAERVKIIISRQLQVNEAQIKPNSDFEADLGADPADVYFLMRSLEQEYDITIPSSDSKNLHTVGETISYLEKRVPQKKQTNATTQQAAKPSSQNPPSKMRTPVAAQPSNPLPPSTASSGASATPARKVVTIADRVKVIIAKRLYLPASKQLKPEDDFEMDLGASPIQVTLILDDLQEEYKIKIPDSAAKKIKTVGEAITYIENEEK
jgi:acyl carrier protein